MSDARLALRRVWRSASRFRPTTMTGAVIAVTVIAYLVEILAPVQMQSGLGYAVQYSVPAITGVFEPWRMLTTLLVHLPITGPGGSLIGITHILFNMYALYLFGPALEAAVGRARMLVVYLLSGLGGSLAVFYLFWFFRLGTSGLVIGASGAIFGVLGAVVVIRRRMRLDIRQLVLVIVINIALDLVVQGISWQAHVGGLVVGGATGAMFITNRGPRRARRAWTLVGSTAAVLVVLALVPATFH